MKWDYKMINEALKLYNFQNPKTTFLRHNENMTYKVCDDFGCYVLRIHKPIDGFNLGLLRLGKEQKDYIYGEIKLLEYLSDNSKLGTQKVIKNLANQSVSELEHGILVTVLEWIDGTTLDNIDISEETAFKVGVMIAALHNSMIGVQLPNRYQYNNMLITEMLSEVRVALEKGHFTDKQAEIVNKTLLFIRGYIQQNESSQILTHSDLSKSNLVFSNDRIIPIDLSLAGYALPEMDIASAYCHFNNQSHQNAIFEGYISTSKLEPNHLGIKVFMCLQILLFVICQHDKVFSESWFSGKTDEWCEQYFKPLITGDNVPYETGLYQ